MSATDFLGLKVALSAGLAWSHLRCLPCWAVISCTDWFSASFSCCLATSFRSSGWAAASKSRQHQIMLELPDTLDILTISIRAGLGFDGALAKVVEKSRGPLADEFRRGDLRRARRARARARAAPRGAIWSIAHKSRP